jgi:hypothetical protein
MTPDDCGSTDGEQNREQDGVSDGRFLIAMVIDSAAAPITLLTN